MLNFVKDQNLTEIGMGELCDYRDTRLEEIEIGNFSYKAIPEFEPETIAVPAFGADTDKGSYNRILAQAAKDANDFYQEDIDVIAQAEVAECIEELNYDEEFEEIYTLFDTSEQSNVRSDYSTAYFVEETCDLMLEENYDIGKVLFTAHMPTWVNYYMLQKK